MPLRARLQAVASRLGSCSVTREGCGQVDSRELKVESGIQGWTSSSKFKSRSLTSFGMTEWEALGDCGTTEVVPSRFVRGGPPLPSRFVFLASLRCIAALRLGVASLRCVFAFRRFASLVSSIFSSYQFLISNSGLPSYPLRNSFRSKSNYGATLMARRQFLTRLAALPFLALGAKADQTKKPLHVLMKSRGDPMIRRGCVRVRPWLAFVGSRARSPDFFLGEATYLMRKATADATTPIGWPPIGELRDKIVARHIPVFACRVCSRRAGLQKPIWRPGMPNSATRRSSSAWWSGRIALLRSRRVERVDSRQLKVESGRGWKLRADSWKMARR